MRTSTPVIFLVAAVLLTACSTRNQTTVSEPSSTPAESSTTVETGVPLSLDLTFSVPEVEYAATVHGLPRATLVVTRDALLFAELPPHSLGSADLEPTDFETVVSLVDGRVPKELKKGGETGLYITPLVERLQAIRGPSKAMERGLVLLVSPNTTYRMLGEILFSAGQARMGRFHFVVTSQGWPGVVDIDAPTLHSPEECKEAITCAGITAVVNEGTSIMLTERAPLLCLGAEEPPAAKAVRVDTVECVQPRLEPQLVGRISSHPGPLCNDAAVVADATTLVGEVLAAASALSLAAGTQRVHFALAATDDVEHPCDAETWKPGELGPIESEAYLTHRRRSAAAVCDWYTSCEDEELVFAMTSQLQQMAFLNSLAWGELFDTAVERGGGTLSGADCMTFVSETSAVQGRRVRAQIEAGVVKFNTQKSVACQRAMDDTFPSCSSRALAFDALEGLKNPSLAGRRNEVVLRSQARLDDLASPAVCDDVLTGTVTEGAPCTASYECVPGAVCNEEGVCAAKSD